MVNTNLLGGRSTGKFGTSRHHSRTTNQRIARTTSATGITNVYSTYFTVPSGMVAMVESIGVLYAAAAGAGVFAVDMRIGGADELHFKFHTDATAHPHTITWATTELALGPGTTIEFKTDASIKAFAHMQMYLLSETEAAVRGLRPAQTFIKGHGTLVADTRTVLVPAVAGKCIEILGMTRMGHITAGGPDNMLLEFSDAGANHHKFFRAYHQNIINWFGKPILLGREPMHCRGPKGYNLSITATAGLVANGAINVYGRYVDEHETYEPTGVPQSAGAYTGRSAKYFWFFSETATATDDLLFPSTAGATTVHDMLARVRGYCYSGSPTAAGCSVTIGGGASTAPIGETWVSSYANASFQHARDDVDLPVMTSSVNPVIGRGAIGFNSCGVTVWGTLGTPDRSPQYVSTQYTGG